MIPFQIIRTKIDATLEAIDEVQAHFSKPVTALEKYPAVVYYEDEFNNEYNGNAENMLTVRYKMFAVVNLGQTNQSVVSKDIMPALVDALMTAFNQEWDFGVTDDGHRIWALLEFGQFGQNPVARGMEAVCEMRLTVKLSTSIT